jgi:hypothetical protein
MQWWPSSVVALCVYSVESKRKTSALDATERCCFEKKKKKRLQDDLEEDRYMSISMMGVLTP